MKSIFVSLHAIRKYVITISALFILNFGTRSELSGSVAPPPATTSTHWLEGLMGPRAGSDALKLIFSLLLLCATDKSRLPETLFNVLSYTFSFAFQEQEDKSLLSLGKDCCAVRHKTDRWFNARSQAPIRRNSCKFSEGHYSVWHITPVFPSGCNNFSFYYQLLFL